MVDAPMFTTVRLANVGDDKTTTAIATEIHPPEAGKQRTLRTDGNLSAEKQGLRPERSWPLAFWPQTLLSLSL